MKAQIILCNNYRCPGRMSRIYPEKCLGPTRSRFRIYILIILVYPVSGLKIVINKTSVK